MEIYIRDYDKRKEILKPFGLVPSIFHNLIFGDVQSVLANNIREEAVHPVIDWTPYLTPVCLTKPYFLVPEYHRGYFNFKYAVAKVIQPLTIAEIGVGAGHSALAFLQGASKARYFGIDDASKSESDKYDYFTWILDKAKEFGFDVTFDIRRSDDGGRGKLPLIIDLFHVDGDHSFEGAYHDVGYAMECQSRFILVDDARDPNVMYAAMKQAYEKGGYKPLYFEDTFTGNLLLIKITGEANG